MMALPPTLRLEELVLVKRCKPLVSRVAAVPLVLLTLKSMEPEVLLTSEIKLDPKTVQAAKSARPLFLRV